MISHYDILAKEGNKDEIITSIGQALKNCQIDFNLILYSNKTSDPQRVAEILYYLGNQRWPQKI